MSEKLTERMSIWDICKEFEQKHSPDVLICVDPGVRKHQWTIRMGATGFSSDGTFSNEASREVIFRKGFEDQVERILESMFCELYDRR